MGFRADLRGGFAYNLNLVSHLPARPPPLEGARHAVLVRATWWWGRGVEVMAKASNAKKNCECLEHLEDGGQERIRRVGKKYMLETSREGTQEQNPLCFL